MSANVDVHPGRLPRFWDRNVVFFANLMSLFYGNTDQTKELAAEVGGIDSYGGRLVSVLNLLFRGGKNLLVLERGPDPDLMNYFAGTLGLELPEWEIMEDSAYRVLVDEEAARADSELRRASTRIRQHPAEWVDGFVTDRQLSQVAEAMAKQTVSTLQGSRCGNNKYYLHLHFQNSGWPVLDTLMAEQPDQVESALEELKARGYAAAVVKAQVGASGIGMIKLSTNAAEMPRIPDHMFYEGACMVQGWLDESVEGVSRVGSPSVQMFLDEDTVSLYDITEQILSADSVHEGNLAPPPYLDEQPRLRETILEQAAVAGRWLHDQGYRGTASADFLAVRRGGASQARICEVNARVTGATYPAIQARNFLPHGAWLMRNLRLRRTLTSPTLLSLLADAGVLYDGGAEEGVFPFNLNVDDDNNVFKGQFLCLAGSRSRCTELMQGVQHALPVESRYDRD